MIKRISALLCSACLLGITATLAAPPPPVPQAMPPAVRELSPHHPQAIRYYLDDAVRAGVMTREEADATQKYMEFRYERRQKDLEYVAGMTTDERRAYMAQKRKERGNPLLEYACYAHLTIERAQALMNYFHAEAKGDKYAAKAQGAS